SKIIESVPNISEARREEVLKRILDSIQGVNDTRVLDVKPDIDHNRTVISLAGSPAGLQELLMRLYESCVREIDLRQHTGEHPRAGAVDVTPFIPIKNSSMEECAGLARDLGKQVADRFGIPVYFYEFAATREDRRDLANIRKGEFEGFAEKIKKPEWKPDAGPDHIHPSAGVTVIGARMPLIAFNVNLATSDIQIANKIAKALRHSSGGLRFVKAMGVMLQDRNIVQVSMNLTDYKKTPVFRAVEMVRREAYRYGVNVVGSELIGLIPSEALFDCADYYLQMENFQYSQVLENKLAEP
ncbi:MAG TPA: glutamate formimidoyltransferase, partial [Acidobacteriota bacterium]|nr:glutamate formimidoyltransferase [Acidobacteriota bacterium]